MADPVTNVEIEDVLSSIRRLVSDEARKPATRSPEAETTFDTANESDDKAPDTSSYEENAAAARQPDWMQVEPKPASATPALILTPALRVSDEDTAEPSTDSGNGASEQADAAYQFEGSPERFEEAESDHSSHDSQSADNAGPEEASAEQAHEDQRQADQEHHGEDRQEHGDHHGDEAHSNTEEQARDTDQHGSTDAEEAEEEGARAEVEDAELAGEGTDEQSAQAENTTADETSGEDHSGADSDTNDENAASEEHSGQSIESKIAALEALVGGTNDQFEPDGAEEPNGAPDAGQSLPWIDARDSGTANTPLPESNDEAQTADFDASAFAVRRPRNSVIEEAASEAENEFADAVANNLDGAFLDEDALRDMVAEIVRQELQGPLGERITRNVRKLVRREIYRALAANELD